MSELVVRRFQSEDGPRIRELNEDALRAAGDYVEGVPEPDLRDVPGTYLTAGSEFLVGLVEGEIVATGAYHPVAEWLLADQFAFERPTAELTRMRVDPAHHRRGYGRGIYRRLERRARADGYVRFVLDTGANNVGARRFYEAQGFEFAGDETVEAFGKTIALAVYRKSIVERDRPANAGTDGGGGR